MDFGLARATLECRHVAPHSLIPDFVWDCEGRAAGFAANGIGHYRCRVPSNRGFQKGIPSKNESRQSLHAERMFSHRGRMARGTRGPTELLRNFERLCGQTPRRSQTSMAHFDPAMASPHESSQVPRRVATCSIATGTSVTRQYHVAQDKSSAWFDPKRLRGKAPNRR